MYIYPSDDFFSKNRLINVSKHTAFASEMIHTHDFIEIMYVSSGNDMHTISGNQYPVKRGSLIYIDHGQSHGFLKNDDLHYYNIYINPALFTNEFLKGDLHDYILPELYRFFYANDNSVSCINFQNDEVDKVEAIVCEMFNIALSASSVSELMLESYLKLLLAYIYRHIKEPSVKIRSIFNEVVNYISSHYNENLTAKSLAEKTFYSPKYFGRIFKKCFGKSLNTYIMEIRLKEAERLLRTTDMSANDIGHTVGYHNNVSFYKYFKNIYGLTPLQYRIKLTQQNSLLI